MKKILFLLATELILCQFSNAQNCWPACGESGQISQAYKSRFPTMVYQATPDCIKAVEALTDRFKQEDRALQSFNAKACAALNGWVEKVPGTCEKGGPLCCPVDHWMKDTRAWSRFQDEQRAIGDRRRAEIDKLLNGCAEKQAQVVKPTNPTTTPKNTGPTEAQRQADLAKQQEAQRKQAAIASENQRRAYLAELERKEAERKRKQAEIDLRAQTNYAMQELGSNLQQMANERMVKNFGSDVKIDKDLSIENPLGSSETKDGSAAASNLSRNAQSLDDMDFNKEYLNAALEPVIKEKLEPAKDAAIEMVQEKIAKSLGLEETYKMGKTIFSTIEGNKPEEKNDDFLPEKAVDHLLEKRIPNELIKEHVSLNIKVIQSVGKKSLSIMDNTMSRIEDIFKELPDDEEQVPSNRGYQTIRTGRSYFRPGNDESEEIRQPSSSSATSETIKRNSSSSSNNSTFFNSSSSRSYSNSSLAPSTSTSMTNLQTYTSSTTNSGSANGSKNTSSSSNTKSNSNIQSNTSSSSSGGFYTNSTNTSTVPVYNYRYTPTRLTQPPPPTPRQQANWTKIRKSRVVPYDTVPPPELRKGYWELNFCAFYSNFR